VEAQAQYEQIANEYSLKILSWAVRKTGSRGDGEDLAQEVMLQVCMAASKEEIERPGHFVWKVAHYCWCNFMRAEAKRKRLVGLSDALRDDSDFVADFIADETHQQALAVMRREITRLSFLQREAMILHYLEGHPVAETAELLQTTESAVAWHLFDARKKVRKELETMNETTYTYRPGRLRVGCNGDPGPDPDTRRFADSLIRQNLCLLCNREAKTLDELTAATGIPKPYLEFDLGWLVEREFLSLKAKRYETLFPIIGRDHFEELCNLYRATRSEYTDKILDWFWSHEQEIRDIGFYGSDWPMERLAWAIITLFIRFMSQENPLMYKFKQRGQMPIRPDGGRYLVMAGDWPAKNEVMLPWIGICCDLGSSRRENGLVCPTGFGIERFFWLGVYGFADKEYHPDIIDRDDPARQAALHRLYCSVINPSFSADALPQAEKELLAEAVADGLIERDGESYQPRFVIFTREQLARLRQGIFQPLLEQLMPKTEELANAIMKMHRTSMPKIPQYYLDYYTYIDLWDFGICTIKFAVEDGRLWLPEAPTQGAPLTLVVVR